MSMSSACCELHDDGVEAHGPAVDVLDGDLGLAVGAQVRHDAVLADLR